MTTVSQARITLIGLTEELDIKGKHSGRYYIYFDGKARDVLGLMLDRLGYEGVPAEHDRCRKQGSNAPGRSPYVVASKLLGISTRDLGAIWQEIDCPPSTNKSIRAKIFQVLGMVDDTPLAAHPASP